MNIGIDALYIRPGRVGGTESYLRNLLKGLEKVDTSNIYYIFTTENNSSTFNFNNDNFKKIVCKVDGENRLKRVLFTNLKLPELIKEHKIDTMFFPTYIRTLTNIKGVNFVSNIHDLQFKHYPEYFTNIQKLVFNIFYPISIRNGNRIIAISNFVKDDLVSKYPVVSPSKIKVIYNPIDFEKLDDFQEEPIMFKKMNISPSNYILSVASLLPHKNLQTLIKAFSHLIEIYPKEKLILVGLKGKTTESIERMIVEQGIENNVVIPGFISNDELSTLYKNARIYVSPSIFEGFGMPPVEAMYKKIPVITTTCASLPEVTFNNAYYYDKPFDDVQLSHVIKELIENPPKRDKLEENHDLVKKAYSLETIALQYKNLFEETLD